MSVWGDVVKTLTGVVVDPVSGVESGVKDLSGAASGVSDTVGVIKTVWIEVSDYRMWRSLGWLLLGVILIIYGILLWTRTNVQEALGGAAKVAEVAA